MGGIAEGVLVGGGTQSQVGLLQYYCNTVLIGCKYTYMQCEHQLQGGLKVRAAILPCLPVSCNCTY